MYDARFNASWNKLHAQAVLILVMLILTACSLLNRDTSTAILGHDTRLEGNAVLVCSQSCQERSQCGTTTDQGTVILGGLFQPQTGPHDVFFPAKTPVTINNVVPYVLRQVSDQQEFSINFYNVVAQDGKAGWVAGWCVAAP